MQRDLKGIDLLLQDVLRDLEMNSARGAGTRRPKRPPQDLRDLVSRLDQFRHLADGFEESGAIELTENPSAFASQRNVHRQQNDWYCRGI